MTLKQELMNQDRDLLEFCKNDYWETLNNEQILNWIHAVVWYLNTLEEKDTQETGLAITLGDCDVDLNESGKSYEDFEGQHFGVKNLYNFLNWSSQRLLNKPTINFQDLPPELDEKAVAAAFE